MWQYNYSTENELYHYGVMGMKWGKRRFHNEDGSLNDRGKRGLSKAYKKEAQKSLANLHKNEADLRVKAYNKTVDDFNTGKIGKRINRHTSPEKLRKEASSLLDRHFDSNFKKMKLSFIKHDENYQNAKALCDTYNMTSFDSLARTNEKALRGIDKVG